ncbi:MAG: DUF6510 family protein [Candidatus Limnocylindria bacterium]
MDDPLMLDANAVAGDMVELFGVEMTMAAHRCAHCGNQGAVGALRAWTHAPGMVLRCSVCDEVVVRWARTSSGVRVDLRGASFLELPGAR